MKSPRQVEFKTPYPSDDDMRRRFAVIERAIRQTDLQIDELEAALGMYLVGFHFGWKVLVVIHNKRTIRKYEELLGINIREVFPEYGPDAHRTNAYKVIQSASSFWKLVSGDIKFPEGVDRRAISD